MDMKLPLSPPPYSAELQPGSHLEPTAPPPHVMPQQQQPGVLVIHNTVVDRAAGNGMQCPACNARVKVRVEHHATGKTYCTAALLCLFLCWPCVCLPCCCSCCYRTTQYCPNCNARLGSFAY
ncbi:lipopolysaccharide-induced tumor necrosis factor-alpha factor [Scaptodrosophila lebanonensis]|uniref:Lipopolysaccharide-induced tumor necrosis factor-alpha factor n=1 Tax=Drosophila lebanonensis TaxID=7225 RepID=A0A6J2UKX0_DROLE|nr:lipopolysaccharide-induced tumor necrosis factor-alpha factor [Scaptodrosophila lebanonensis]XP_030387878.1 lipopolysaccharide-induced tumor necrosis factor-alpha factor [Scaptodrosophila lebanonensis]